MAKDPAVLLYTNDFLTGCSGLTMEERGQYITLLCLQHQQGHLSEKTCRLSVGSVSDDVLDKFKKDENGLLYNERMEKEIEKRRNSAEIKRLNGMKGGRPKTEKEPIGKPKHKPKKNLPENEDENENINKTVNEPEIKPPKIELVFPFNSLQFIQVWDVLVKEPNWKKKTKTALQSVLKKLSKYPESDAIQMMEEAIAGGWKNVYELKNQNNGNRTTKTEYGTPERAAEYDRLFAQRYGGR